MPYWLRTLRTRLTNWYATHYRLVLCASTGAGIQVSQPRYLTISGPGIHLGNHCRLDPTPDAHIHLSCWPYAQSPADDQEEVDAGSPGTTAEPHIRIGDYCTLSPGVRVIAASSIEAGHSCMFASNVYVTDADWHDRYHRVYPPGPTAPVVFGNNVWLAERVIVLKGVNIGDNSIVGAGAVVVDDLPANVIAAGNPAKVIAQLDPDAPATNRKALFEELGFADFEPEFWRQQAKGNGFWRWLLGALWPAARESRPRS